MDPSYHELRSRLDFPKKYDPHNKLVHLFFVTSDPKWYTLEYTKVLLEAFPSIKLSISLILTKIMIMYSMRWKFFKMTP